LRRDLRLLARFVAVYCRAKHGPGPHTELHLRGFDLAALCGRVPRLCPPCTKLLQHAFVMRSRCPLDPKPACKHCPQHCYAPAYRAAMRDVMKFSGRRLVLRGRLDYLWHLLA
jgi:hypothetical protein